MIKNILNKAKMFALVGPVFAEDTINLGAPKGDLADLTKLTVPGIISGAIGLIILVVALVFFFMLVMGGLKWVTSGGDEKKVGEARSQITNALIGLVIVFGAWAVMKLIDTVFGVHILNGLTIPDFKP